MERLQAVPVQACKSEENAGRVINLLRSMIVFDPAER